MKRAILAVLVVAGIGFVSCKKEYTCCYYDADGKKLESGSGGICATAKMSKSDMETTEKNMDAAAKMIDSKWSAKCE
jgi:hypothetical protein